LMTTSSLFDKFLPKGLILKVCLLRRDWTSDFRPHAFQISPTTL
jgi:hypothetical protein